SRHALSLPAALPISALAVGPAPPVPGTRVQRGRARARGPKPTAYSIMLYPHATMRTSPLPLSCLAWSMSATAVGITRTRSMTMAYLEVTQGAGVRPSRGRGGLHDLPAAVPGLDRRSHQQGVARARRGRAGAPRFRIHRCRGGLPLLGAVHQGCGRGGGGVPAP